MSLSKEVIARNLARFGIKVDRIVTPYGDFLVKEPSPLTSLFKKFVGDDEPRDVRDARLETRGELTLGLKGRNDHEF